MTKTAQSRTIDDLITVRDWLRFAVSRFNAADLVYGHGTASAMDEAAFLILTALHLPIDELDPWLDARLTRDERERILELIEQRVATRKPAPYLVNAAWVQGQKFYVDERVIVPRSYIGELLGSGQEALVASAGEINRVLDLCTGSGCLAILAALTYPDAAVDAADISADALEVARRNVSDYGLGEQVRIVESDLFSALEGETYDLIISNPPYVTAAAMAAFPPEHRAEPAIAHAGGEDGLDLVRRIMADASRHLAPNGLLIVEVGAGREALEAAYPDLDFLWLETETSSGEVFALSAEALRAGTPKRAKARE